MEFDFALWGTVILIGCATHLPRASFIVLGNRIALPPALQRALRYAPAAALAAIISTDVFLVAGELQPINPKLLAAVLAFAAALYTRNPWLPFIAGMGTLLTVQFLTR